MSAVRGPLHFFAGDCAGECAPSGETVESIFGAEDAAAALYLASLYSGSGRSCWVHDSDIDGDSHPEVDEDDLSDAEFARLNRMRDIVWTERLFGLSAKVGPFNVDVSFHEGNPHGRWYASMGSASLWADGHREAQARVVAAALDAQVPA